MHPARKPLYFTFGNHMHWTSMQWLWGYDVLPSSTRDMLHLIGETGARGNVNFDAVGYEKMAVDAPQALNELRTAVQDGIVEVVGGSYGQPYGLFHGGESNVRQRIFGVRTVLRLLGVRPRAFWEEEFDFCPQLPQILALCGYRGASLFFQWTWHTPVVPEESCALVMWEGLDGTKLATLPRNELCLHQWPQDFDGRLESPLLHELERPAIVQWLELLPSADWMCRSEVMLPRLHELFADRRFEVRPVTLSKLIELLHSSSAPVRRYGLDDVFHGVSLGKNGDFMPRASHRCELQLLAAECAASLAGFFGRPYPSWHVYPTWELEESWRELLAAQHHDNHECEGLCGFIGERSFERSEKLSEHVLGRTLRHLARHVEAPRGSKLCFNPLGWTRDVFVPAVGRDPYAPGILARGVPPFGWKVVDPATIAKDVVAPAAIEEDERSVTLRRGELSVTIDKERGAIAQIHGAQFPAGCVHADQPLATLSMTRGGKAVRYARTESVHVDVAPGPNTSTRVVVTLDSGSSRCVEYSVSLAPVHDAVEVKFDIVNLRRPDGGMHAGLQTPIAPCFAPQVLLHDHPYGVSQVHAERDHVRKYPTGDWMTSPQVYETVRRPFTALTFVDLLDAASAGSGHDGGRGLMVVHDGSQAFFRDSDGVRNLLTMYDPWDESFWRNDLAATLWFVPHGPMTHGQRVRLAAELRHGAMLWTDAPPTGKGAVPPIFGAVHVEAAHVVPTAFYREAAHAGEHLPDWFGRKVSGGTAAQSGPHGASVRDPHVLRLVEMDGTAARTTLRVAGKVASAARTNLLGEVLEVLRAVPAAPAFGPASLPWSAFSLSVRPHEIITLMLDIEQTRHVARDLDQHSHVWAKAHRHTEHAERSAHGETSQRAPVPRPERGPR